MGDTPGEYVLVSDDPIVVEEDASPTEDSPICILDSEVEDKTKVLNPNYTSEEGDGKNMDAVLIASLLVLNSTDSKPTQSLDKIFDKALNIQQMLQENVLLVITDFHSRVNSKCMLR